jgi:HEAT repeat protein
VHSMNSLQVDELFKQTLTGDHDDDAPWAAITQLRLNGNRAIFLQAADWLHSGNALKRARATAILAKLRSADEAGTENRQSRFREEALRLICEMLERETDAMVIADGIAALAHLQDAATIPVVIKYKDHLDWSVRFAVAFALGHFPEDPMSVPALMWLTDDVDPHLRDWAVSGLGVMGDADSLPIFF